ncbi:MAG: sulfite exporter TauE/SafE family protein [Treponema sp.]|nr:sulfite exporter TauE/SafE family protein [Treponema sp.]
MEIIFGMIIILVAGFIQGLTTFGLSLVAIPFLILIIPLQQIVPIIVVLALLTNSLVLYNARKNISFKKFIPLLLAAILFLPVGAHSLRYMNTDYLKLVFGILVTGFSLLLIMKKTFPIKHEKAGYMATGSLSGFLNGSLSISGPPVVLFLSIQGVSKDAFRANITLYFMILNTVTVAIFLAHGLLNRAVFEQILYLAPALVVGVLAGIRVSRNLKDETFKKVVLILLVATGVWTTISTLVTLAG